MHIPLILKMDSINEAFFVMLKFYCSTLFLLFIAAKLTCSYTASVQVKF